MKKNPTMGSNQGRSGNNSNQKNNSNYIQVNKDKRAEEIPGKDYHHLFNIHDASKPRNVTVNYKF